MSVHDRNALSAGPSRLIRPDRVRDGDRPTPEAGSREPAAPVRSRNDAAGSIL